MERRRLGRTGHESSVLIYGAAALSDVDQDTADTSLGEALAAGINHFDVARDYGEAEVRMAPWLRDHRGEIFLATKTGRRDAEGAWRGINESLERLGVDSVDLLQLHAVGDLEELDKATAPDGALKAAVRAQDEGLAADIGITGHGHTAPGTHLEALRRHPFATVLTPLNPALWARTDYRTDYEALVAEAGAHDVGLMVIKTVSRRNWPEGSDHGYATWYEPQSEPAKIRAAVSWALSHDEVTGLATPGDVRLLRHVVAAEQDRMPADEAEAFLTGDPEYSSPFVAMPF
jgi:aryl-alcohol dehydrogenase-like predicted oxidoreductase